MDNYPLKPRLIYAHDTYPRTSIVPAAENFPIRARARARRLKRESARARAHTILTCQLQFLIDDARLT